jgi:hypothetical protein
MFRAVSRDMTPNYAFSNQIIYVLQISPHIRQISSFCPRKIPFGRPTFSEQSDHAVENSLDIHKEKASKLFPGHDSHFGFMIPVESRTAGPRTSLPNWTSGSGEGLLERRGVQQHKRSSSEMALCGGTCVLR